MTSKKEKLHDEKLKRSFEPSDFIFWQIELLEERRDSISNRASIVLSADAILLAAVILLLDGTLDEFAELTFGTRATLGISFAVATIFVMLSLAYASSTIANVWKTSKKMSWARESKMPPRLFFHQRETLEAFVDYPAFENTFLDTSKEQMRTYALGMIWTLNNQNQLRYENLRRSIRSLLIAIGFFLLIVLQILITYF